MVPGASTAQLAIILIDARKGVVEQTKRHTFIASLLGINHIAVCVNKMDLVDYKESVFNEIVKEYKGFVSRLDVADVTFIPISALKGDNVVDVTLTNTRNFNHGGWAFAFHATTPEGEVLLPRAPGN